MKYLWYLYSVVLFEIAFSYILRKAKTNLLICDNSNTLNVNEVDQLILPPIVRSGRLIHFDWPYTQHEAGPVSVSAEKSAISCLVKPGEYYSTLSLPENRIEEIRTKCGKLNMKLEQALSLRKQLIVQKIMERSHKIKDNLKQIIKRYLKGESILLISNELDLPPVAVFRAILSRRVQVTYSELLERDRKVLIKMALKGEGEAYKTLVSERDWAELEKAKAVDQLSYSIDPQEKRMADMWEEAMYKFFDARDVSYVTEGDLYAAGYKSTPDVVLQDNCFINGKEVHWIDCKNYYGSTSSKVFVKKLSEQARKYDQAFGGPGALVYRLGFSQELVDRLPGTLLLDSGPLDVSPPPLDVL